jgi:N-acetylmuramoyl-L-alanine amidase
MQINFYVASLLATDLQRDGVKVIMTKNSLKLYLTNKRRALIANWAHANLFLRLHCDANSGSGFAVYYPGAPGVAADGTKGPSQHVINASRIAANKFHAGLVEGIAGELVDNGVKTDAETAIGAKQGALTGSIYSECPTVLVEMLTLTNLKDEKWIMNRRHPAILAHALEKGVLAALGENEQQ